MPRPKEGRAGLVMGLHIAVIPSPSGGDATQSGDVASAGESSRAGRGGEGSGERGERVALVAGYEDGRVEVWTCPLQKLLERKTEWDGRKAEASGEKLWMRVWEGKAHNEAGECVHGPGFREDIGQRL